MIPFVEQSCSAIPANSQLGDDPMAIVKLRDASAKTPIDIGAGYNIKHGRGVAYVSRNPDTRRRKRRNATTVVRTKPRSNGQGSGG